MSNLMRFEPMREMITMREAMDRLFDDAFTRPLGTGSGFRVPAVNMYQTDNDVIVQAAVPGLKVEDVQITITGDVLTLKGEFKEKAESKDKAYHIREQSFGAFERSLRLPGSVIADKSKAEFEDGIMTITLPRAEDERPKTITVKAK
jgi:HSP20 family protein